MQAPPISFSPPGFHRIARRLAAQARRWLVALPFLAAAGSGLSGGAQAEIALVFGVYASDKPSAMVDQLRPTLDLLQTQMSERLGETVAVKLLVARDYETGLADLMAARVDFARLGAASYVAAKDQAPGIEVLAAERYGESKIFEGVICVATKSTIRQIGDLRGKTFAFGDEQSTLGRYIAQLYLARAGITSADLKAFKYLERHDRVGAAVASGQFDAGALEQTMFDKLVAAGAPIRAIASFPTVTKPWVARVDLAPRIKHAITRALVAIRDPAVLAALRFDGFETADDADYEMTRASIKENWRFFRISPS
jgi:phosphonate transport system substrate-binding protein